MSERLGRAVLAMAEWDGWILYRSAAGTCYLRWPNPYLEIVYETNKADLLRLTAEQAQTALTALETADLLANDRELRSLLATARSAILDLVAAVRQHAAQENER